MSPLRFASRTAIVTGGGAGIGRAIARRLSSEGASVLIADRDATNGASTAKTLRDTGGAAAFIEMDVGHSEDAKRTVQQAVAEFGRLDILINCAASLGERKPFLDTNVADWQSVLGTNVIGTFAVTHAAVSQMLAQGSGGAIVNILAIQAYAPLPTYGPYAASKGALISMTRTIAVELADKGIRVNGIAVGSIYTEGTRDLLNVPGAAESALIIPDEIDRTAATLIGRMGRPDDIARVACFLASEDAAYLAGAIIPADGGRMMSRKPDPFLSSMEQMPRESPHESKRDANK